MRVIIKEPNEDARVEYIDNTLEELQSIVGGYIEVIPFTFDDIIICNEEGRLRKLSHNFYMPVHGDIVGTVILCGDTMNNDFCDTQLTIDKFNQILTDWGNEV